MRALTLTVDPKQAGRPMVDPDGRNWETFWLEHGPNVTCESCSKSIHYGVYTTQRCDAADGEERYRCQKCVDLKPRKPAKQPKAQIVSPKPPRSRYPWVVMDGSAGANCERCGAHADFTTTIGQPVHVYVRVIEDFGFFHSWCKEPTAVPS